MYNNPELDFLNYYGCDGEIYLDDRFGSTSRPARMIALDPNTGREKWRYPLRDKELPIGCTEGLLYIGEPGNVKTLDSSTGAVKWSYPVAGDVHTLVGAGDTIYPGLDDTIIAVDIEKRSERWRCRVGGPVAQLSVTDDLVLYSTGDDGRLGAVAR